MLTGQNGILNKAAEAKEKSLSAEQKENSILTNYEDQISNYVGIDWDQAKNNAKAPAEQKEERNNGVIGIGADGKPVNMDLWEYCKSTDGKYVLNQISSGNAEGPGYIGTLKDGKIEGCIPQYIKGKNDNQFVEVISLRYTFLDCTELKITPIIPETIINMSYAFKNSGITSFPSIPNSVQYLNWCFENTKINNAKFTISENIKSIEGMFYKCSELQNIYLKVDYDIDSIAYTLSNCPNIYGEIIINKTPTKYNNFFTNSAFSDNKINLNGSSNKLQEIYQTKSENSNIEIIK